MSSKLLWINLFVCLGGAALAVWSAISYPAGLLLGLLRASSLFVIVPVVLSNTARANQLACLVIAIATLVASIFTPASYTLSASPMAVIALWRAPVLQLAVTVFALVATSAVLLFLRRAET